MCIFQTEFVSIDHNNVPRHRDVMATLEVYKEESDTEDTISSVDSDDESIEDLHVMDETLFQTPSRSPTPPTDIASPTPTNLTSPTLSVSPDIFPINTISNENHPPEKNKRKCKAAITKCRYSAKKNIKSIGPLYSVE